MSSPLWTPTRRLMLGAAAGAFAGGQSAFADPAQGRAITVSGTPNGARIVIATDQVVTPQTFFLNDPPRFVVDVPNTVWAAAGRSAGESAGAGAVRRYRYAPRPDGSARLVLDLDGPAEVIRQERAGGRAAPEVVYELRSIAPGSAIIAPATVTTVAATSNAAPIDRPVPLRPGQGRRVVVVDAGHGGRDPGAVGVTGVREKDVVLDAAMQLRDCLEARGPYRVVLTRDADVFLPLQDRVRVARGQGADLFISLHADANANTSATGASVYTLSESGATRAQNMMDSQNWQIDTGPAPRGGVVSDILVDLAQRETTNRSATFAQTVISDLGAGQVPLLENTHRRAGFFVLLAPDVPAVLIEMGFLTNLQDERRLAEQRQRQRMAEVLAGAVDHYFAAPGRYLARA